MSSRYEQRLASGNCGNCGASPPRAGSVLCVDCSEHQRDRGRERYHEAIPSAKTTRCGSCGEAGHNARTCPKPANGQREITISCLQCRKVQSLIVKYNRRSITWRGTLLCACRAATEAAIHWFPDGEARLTLSAAVRAQAEPRAGEPQGVDRVLVVNDSSGRWFARRVLEVTHDGESDHKIYRCDAHLGGPFETGDEALACAKLQGQR